MCDNMAALMRHGLLKGGQELKLFSNYLITRNNKRIPRKKKPLKNMEGKVVLPNCESRSERSYLRPTKAYQPPYNVEEQFKKMCVSVTGRLSFQEPLTNNTKFQLLVLCFNTFKHSVPNGILHTINTPDDILNFYKTEVDPAVPLDKLKDMNLPKNIHVLYEYNRFHPETDTKFDGISAFPQSSTLVTGLKYKKKYQGYETKPHWH